MRMLHCLLMPVAGAWRRRRGISLFGARWLVLSSIFLHSFHYTFYFLSLWTKVCTSTLDVWWLFGSTDILSNWNHSGGNSKTVTLGQPPILYVLLAELEWLVPHMCWGKNETENLYMMVCENLVKYVFLDDSVLLWCDVHTLLGSLVLCLSASMFFSMFCVSEYDRVTEIELNVLQLP